MENYRDRALGFLPVPEEGFYRQVTPAPGFWGAFGTPALLAGALVLIDFFLVPGVFSLPLMLLMLLIFLAMRLPAGAVALWTLFFGGLILIILLMPIEEAATDPAFRPYIRTSVFLAGGAAAILLAAYRQRLELGHDALFRIISSLPLAVIVSDISGNILLLNEQAQQVLKNHINNLAGLSYFSTFISPSDQGKTIARYISYFDPAHAGTVSTVLHTRGEPALALHASITVVGIDQNRYAITVVERVEHVAGV
jgi:PAS domain-containing protein